MTLFDERAIVDTLKGAALLASGGGGSLGAGLAMLEAFRSANPGVAIEIQVHAAQEMRENAVAASIAVMGAPSGGAEQDVSSCVLYAYNELQKLAAANNQKVEYVFPIEMGGFNTFVPMLIALADNTPLVDADACGRAVPALDTLLSHINGCATSPVAMADVYNNRVVIQTADAKDAVRVQQLALPIVRLFDQNAGIAGWMMGGGEMLNTIPTKTITLARGIGELLTRAEQSPNRPRDIFEEIERAGIAGAKTLSTHARVLDFKSSVIGGWDVGDFYIAASGAGEKRFHIRFANESLVLTQIERDSETVLVTAPDIITLYDSETYYPLTNEDLLARQQNGALDSLRVTLGVIAVNDLWWANPDKTQQAWQPYFDIIGYGGKMIRYEQLVKA